MKFAELLHLTSTLSCFNTSFLAAGQNIKQVRLQLSRWVKDGRLIKIHKGFYVLASEYLKVKREPFYIANKLKSPSYISLQSALSYYGLIPEYVPTVTSITTLRPQRIDSPYETFDYRHVDKSLFWGYVEQEFLDKQKFLIAKPEKALIDLIYLTPAADKKDYLTELRLQNLEIFNLEVFSDFVKKINRPKLYRAEKIISKIINNSIGVSL